MKKALALLVGLLLTVSISGLSYHYVGNDTGEVAYSLRVVFSESVEITGFGDTLTEVFPEGPSSTFTFGGGEVQAWVDGLWFTWSPASARVLEEAWITDSDTEEDSGADVVLYHEDFEGGRADDWQIEGDWRVIKDTDGNYVLRGREHNWATYVGDAWGDYTFSLRLKIIRGRIHLNFRARGCTRYFIGIEPTRIDLSKTQPCETHRLLRYRDRDLSTARWYKIKIVGQQNHVEVYLDSVLVLSFTDPNPVLFGGIALETLDNAEFYIDDITVQGQRPETLATQWVRTGGPLGGLGYDIRMHPQDPDLLYVTDSFGGVSMSTDGGHTWAPMNTGITTRTGPSGDSIPVFSLTICPHNPDTIWVGTQGTRGIFMSEDGGRSWEERTSGIVEREGISFRGFTVHPLDPNTVYAAAEISSFAWTEDGSGRMGKEFDLTMGVVYKTTNRGESWTAIWRGDNLARYVLINPVNPDIMYVSTGIFDREAANTRVHTNTAGGVGILKSVDGGQTWRVLNEANGLKNLYIGSLFMHPTDPDVLLAGAGNNAWAMGSGVYLSDDAGESWQCVARSGDSAVASVEYAVSNTEVAYAGGECEVLRSEDGGHTWRRVNSGSIWGPPGVRAGVPIDFQVDPRDPDRIFVNNYGGGNFLSEDGGRTWVSASAGYTGAQLRDIAIDPLDPQRVYVIGRTGPFRSFDAGANWEGLNYHPATCAEWYAVAVDPSNSRTVLISDEHEGIVLRSTDGGLMWSTAFRHPHVGGHDFHERHGIKAITFAPSNPSFVYAGMSRETRNIDEGRADPSFGVYVSTNGGLTWNEANDTHTSQQNVNTIAVHPHDDQVVCIGTVTNGVFKTTNGGQSWLPVNQGLRVLDIRALAIDPQNPQIIYAGAEDGGIYRTANGGASWVESSAGMDPEARIRDIVIDPTDPQVVYAADLSTGVYRSNDGGSTWVRMSEGLSTRAVTSLALSGDGKVLYAATDGEGVFRIDLSDVGGG